MQSSDTTQDVRIVVEVVNPGESGSAKWSFTDSILSAADVCCDGSLAESEIEQLSKGVAVDEVVSSGQSLMSSLNADLQRLLNRSVEPTAVDNTPCLVIVCVGNAADRPSDSPDPVGSYSHCLKVR